MVCPPSKVIFHHRSSYFKGCFPLLIIGRLSSKGLFYQGCSSIKGHIPSEPKSSIIKILPLTIQCSLDVIKTVSIKITQICPIYIVYFQLRPHVIILHYHNNLHLYAFKGRCNKHKGEIWERSCGRDCSNLKCKFKLEYKLSWVKLS